MAPKSKTEKLRDQTYKELKAIKSQLDPRTYAAYDRDIDNAVGPSALYKLMGKFESVKETQEKAPTKTAKAKQTNKANKENNKKIVEEFKINSLLTTAKEAEQEVFIWRLVGGSKYLASVKIETIRKARKDFSISPQDGHERLVQDMLSSQNFIALYVPESAMLFRCNIKQAETPSRYFLEFPEFVAQVERRKHLRLNVYRSEEVKINFDKYLPIVFRDNS
jgi:hypothetical protein